MNRDDFLITKNRLEIRLPLKLQTTRIIVKMTNKRINLNELIIYKRENLSIPACLLFLLLIHI